MKLVAKANVALTVEIQATGAYGLDWTLDDLHKAVVREAEQKVRGWLPQARIVGDPKVTVCTFEVE